MVSTARLAESPPDLVVLDASFVLRYLLHTEAPRPHPAGLGLLRGDRKSVV